MITYLLLFLLSSEAQACKCDTGPIQQMYKNPALAQTAFVAKSEGKGKNRVFKVIQSWTPYREKIKAPATSKCSLDTKPGHTYLIYSLGSIEEIEKRNIGFTICDSFASEIDDAEPIIEKLVDIPTNNDISPNPSWFYCTRSTDCVSEKGVCSDAVGVNKKFRKRLSQWVLKTSPLVKCMSSRDVPTGKAECKNYFCEADIRPPAFMDKKKLEKSPKGE